MSKHLREPRGAKSAAHLEMLRQSDPTPGSLYPRKLRGSATEVTYDPLDRWMSLSRYLREPRGAKSLNHLQVLRHAPGVVERQWTERGPAAGWLKAELLGFQLDPAVPRHELSLDEGEGEEAVSTSTGDSWQMLRPSGARLPRILSNQVLETLHDDDDFNLGEASDLSHALPSGRMGTSVTRSTSFDSDDLEDESLRSAALTAHERSSRTERESNDTIGSFLDDASDSLSAFGSLPDTPRSPMRTGPSGWAPPRGVFKDEEMASRMAAKAMAASAQSKFEADEIRSRKQVAAAFKASGFKVPAKDTQGKTSGKNKDAIDKDPLGKAALLDLA
jgi:hypothetical protein